MNMNVSSVAGCVTKTSRGMHINMISCDNQYELTEEDFVIEDIVVTFGTP